MRQYIGARYMPKFMGTYDPTTAYEALSVVDNGMGTSYVSNQPVPPGTPLTNTAYWALYGASNGAIINLQNEVAALQVDVGLLKDKKYIFVSDSYGARVYNSKTLIENIANLAGIDSASYVSVQQNGSGFIGIANVDNFLTILQNATISIDPSEITDIIVLGGANDITQTQAAVEQAIDTFCSYCKTTYPNATIQLAHVGRFWDKARHTLTVNVSLPAWRNCTSYGAKYIKNSEYILHKKSLVESDEVHPNAAGVLEIAKQIANAIYTGSCDVHYRTTATIDVMNGALFTSVSHPGNSPITISVDNDITTVNFGSENRIVAQMAAAQAFSTDITISDIANITQSDDCALFGNFVTNTTQGVGVTACPLDGVNGLPVAAIPGIMYIGSAGNILFNLQNRFINGYATNTYIGTQIYIPNQSYTVPSELC